MAAIFWMSARTSLGFEHKLPVPPGPLGNLAHVILFGGLGYLVARAVDRGAASAGLGAAAGKAALVIVDGLRALRRSSPVLHAGPNVQRLRRRARRARRHRRAPSAAAGGRRPAGQVAPVDRDPCCGGRPRDRHRRHAARPGPLDRGRLCWLLAGCGDKAAHLRIVQARAQHANRTARGPDSLKEKS